MDENTSVSVTRQMWLCFCVFVFGLNCAGKAGLYSDGPGGGAGSVW